MCSVTRLAKEASFAYPHPLLERLSSGFSAGSRFDSHTVAALTYARTAAISSGLRG